MTGCPYREICREIAKLRGEVASLRANVDLAAQIAEEFLGDLIYETESGSLSGYEDRLNDLHRICGVGDMLKVTGEIGNIPRDEKTSALREAQLEDPNCPGFFNTDGIHFVD